MSTYCIAHAPYGSTILPVSFTMQALARRQLAFYRGSQLFSRAGLRLPEKAIAPPRDHDVLLKHHFSTTR